MTRSRDPWADAYIDRFGIFVPAIMSAGLLFSIVTLLRDAVHGRRHRHRERRVEIAAAGAEVMEVEATGTPDPATQIVDGDRPAQAPGHRIEFHRPKAHHRPERGEHARRVHTTRPPLRQ